MTTGIRPRIISCGFSVPIPAIPIPDLAVYKVMVVVVIIEIITALLSTFPVFQTYSVAGSCGTEYHGKWSSCISKKWRIWGTKFIIHCIIKVKVWQIPIFCYFSLLNVQSKRWAIMMMTMTGKRLLAIDFESTWCGWVLALIPRQPATVCKSRMTRRRCHSSSTMMMMMKKKKFLQSDRVAASDTKG